MNTPWQKHLQRSVRSPSELAKILGRPVEEVFASKRFPTIVSDSYLARMNLKDGSDPLLRQVLPDVEEDQVRDGFQTDPLAEHLNLKGSGLIQKYKGRLLIVCGSTCAIHCRYCFRKNFDYTAQKFNKDEVSQVIKESPDVWEVLLSGGDPLCADERSFYELIEFLFDIKQVRSIRIHTRMPVVLPSRVNHELLNVLNKRPATQKLVMVIHANHPNELKYDAAEAITKLASSCDFFLNQSVLLRGINDSFAVQNELCRQLLRLGVLPYYIHQLDPVIGTSHFKVDEVEGVKIIEELRAVLPGYAVPRYVRETPGELSKTLII